MFWTKKIITDNKGKKINAIATGITPSGYIHLGNLREVVVADVCYKALKQNGKNPKFYYIADDFDNLRKMYPFLPSKFKEHIGKPLSKIPDPFGDCHRSYSEHFLDDFLNNLPKLGIDLEYKSATKLYKEGFYTKGIDIALEKTKEIKKILSDISHRELSDDWSAYNPLCDSCGKITDAKVVSFDLDKKTVNYQCSCGNKGVSHYDKGQGKLTWRVDWAARWFLLDVGLEPMGKDHSSAGGSFDTSKKIVEEIYQIKSPYQVNYEFVYLKGTSGKMSSSIGNVVSSSEILEVVAPELVRYLLIKNKDRHLDFDLRGGFLKLIDEYTILEQKILNNSSSEEEKSLYHFSEVTKDQTILNIPFRHLSFALQINNFDLKKTEEFLNRTDHKISSQKLFKSQASLIKNWLNKYASDEERYQLCKTIPKIDLKKDQEEFIKQLIEKIENIEWIGEYIHKAIHELKSQMDISASDAFGCIYRLFLNRKQGPQAGWFLAGLEKNFVISRFKEALKRSQHA